MADLKRNIEHYFTQSGSELSDGQFQFFTQTGEEVDLSSQILSAIENLGPNQSVIATAIVGVTDNAPPFKALDYLFGLGIDKPTDPETRLIQERALTIRTSHAYKKIEGSKVLFVTNSSIPEEVINGFKKQFGDLGETMSIWDLSYENHLDLEQNLDFNGQLLENFRNRMIVIPTNEFQVSSDKFSPENQLRKPQFLKALAKYNIQVAFVGPERNENLLSSLLIPTEGNVLGEPMSVAKLLKAHARGNLPAQQAFNEDGVFNRYSLVEINGTSFWGEPKESHIQEKAEDVDDGLHKRDRHSRWVTVYNFEPELIRKGLFGTNFLAKWKYGRLTVLRTTDLDQASGGHATVSEDELLNGDYSSSSELKMSLLQFMGFEKNVELLERYMTEPKFAEAHKDSLKILMESILAYLAYEQGLLRDRAISFRAESQKKNAVFLNRLTRVNQMTDETPGFVKEAIAQLAGQALFLVNSDINLWNFINPFNHNEKVARASREEIFEFVDQAFDSKLTFAGSVAQNPFRKTHREKVFTEVYKFNKQEKRAFRESIGGMWSSFKRFFTPAKQEHIQDKLKAGGAQVNGRDEVRGIMTEPEYIAMAAETAKRDEEAGNLDAHASTVRDELYLPHPRNHGKMTCGDYLGGGGTSTPKFHSDFNYPRE